MKKILKSISEFLFGVRPQVGQTWVFYPYCPDPFKEKKKEDYPSYFTIQEIKNGYAYGKQTRRSEFEMTSHSLDSLEWNWHLQK